MIIEFRSPLKFSTKSVVDNRNLPELNNSFTSSADTVDQMMQILGITKSTIATKFNSKIVSGQQSIYDDCEGISSIIDKKGGYLVSGKLKFYDSNGDEMSGYKVNDIQKLLSNPNPMMDGDEFMRVVNVYIHSFGYCPIYKIYPVNRKTGTPIALWPINPIHFSYDLTGRMFLQSEIKGIIQRVMFNHLGSTEQITLEGDAINDILILNWGSPSKKDYYTSQSPLFSLGDLAGLFTVASQSYGQLVSRAIMGMVTSSMKDQVGRIKMNPKEKIATQRRLDNFGTTDGKDQLIVTDFDLKFISMLSNVGNLQLPQAIQLCVNEFCNRLNFRPELLSKDGITFENQKQAQIDIYQNTIIPFSDAIYFQLSQFIDPVGPIAKRDYLQLPIFNTDKSGSNKTNAETIKVLFDTGKFTDQELRDLAVMFNLIEKP